MLHSSANDSMTVTSYYTFYYCETIVNPLLGKLMLCLVLNRLKLQGRKTFCTTFVLSMAHET